MLKQTKNKMRGLLTAALTMAAFSAQAADIYAGGGLKDAPVYVPTPSWQGFYFGANIGASWANLDTKRNTFYDDRYNLGSTYELHHATFGGKNLDSTGALGGGQFGYNFQSSNFVYGVEVDLGGAGGNNEVTFSPTTFHRRGDIDQAAVITLKENGGFYGDVTGRLGYTWGSTLVYAKGGFAWFEPSIKASARVVDNRNETTNFYSRSNSDNLTGYTVGGGVEWMLNPNWTMKVEYLYFDFGNDDKNWNVGDGINAWRLADKDLTVNTVKLGFNYHLTNNYVPLK